MRLLLALCVLSFFGRSYAVKDWLNNEDYVAFNRFAQEKKTSMVYSGVNFGVLLSALMADLPNDRYQRFKINGMDNKIREQCVENKAKAEQAWSFESSFQLDVPQKIRGRRTDDLLRKLRRSSCIDIRRPNGGPAKFTGFVDLMVNSTEPIREHTFYKDNSSEVLELILVPNELSLYFMRDPKGTPLSFLQRNNWASVKKLMGSTKVDSAVSFVTPAINSDTSLETFNYVKWLKMQKYQDDWAVFKRNDPTVVQRARFVFPKQQIGENANAETFSPTAYVLYDKKNDLDLFTGVVL